MIVSAVVLLLAIAWVFVLLVNHATSPVVVIFLSLLSLSVPNILVIYATRTSLGGLTLTSTRIINGTIVTTVISVSLIVALSDAGIITPFLFAILGALIFTFLVIAIIAVVVKEQGWQAIFPE